MFIKLLFIGGLMFGGYARAAKESETMKTGVERQIDKDFNHPGNLIRVQNLQRHYDELDEEIRDKFPECKNIDSSLRPAGMEVTDRSIFDYIFQEWWSIFTHSKSDVIQRLKEQTEKLANATTVEEKAALMAQLNYGLCKIATSRAVYTASAVTVRESDEDSVIHALKVWGMSDEKLVNAARAVYRVCDGPYSKDNVVWPRKYENSTAT